ncbi:TPA: VOC family protein [Streptococcus pyogenes]|nr:VOC family protein [Streptococcus pyogenes]HEP2108050.1 VOC family protein [Streptococcus pyogenes]HEP2291492.1 VOC family protein [Streptococcus pyogenes]HEP2300459.1 VOC family protein [Streptococcus pyogenes]HEP2315277.1 VOC family protein [Streptococcus pyogenes]
MKALHTCIRVKDLDQSVAFYTSAFPFKENYRKDFPDSQFTLVYLALESEHFEADHKKHRQAGFPVTDIKELADKSARYYFIQDPDGYKIEVIDLNN